MPRLAFLGKASTSQTKLIITGKTHTNGIDRPLNWAVRLKNSSLLVHSKRSEKRESVQNGVKIRVRVSSLVDENGYRMNTRLPECLTLTQNEEMNSSPWKLYLWRRNAEEKQWRASIYWTLCFRNIYGNCCANSFSSLEFNKQLPCLYIVDS